KSIRRCLRWTSSSHLKEQVLPDRYAVSSKPSVKDLRLALLLSQSQFRSTRVDAGSQGRAPMWIGLRAPGSFVNLSIRKLRSATLPTPSLTKSRSTCGAPNSHTRLNAVDSKPCYQRQTCLNP